MAPRPVLRRIGRDSILFSFGLLGITYQTVTDRVSVPLLIVFGLAAGIPGIASLLSLLEPLRSGSTTSSPSPSQPASSSSPSSSPP